MDQLFADEQVNWSDEDADGEVLWALTDNVGSVRDVIDSNGDLRVHRRFDGFGNVVAETHYNTSGTAVTTGQTGFVDEAFAFTGRWLDKTTGLQNNLNRWYDPQVGRWLSEDPMGLTVDANPYRYVSNQPTSYIDPTGLAFIPGLPPDRQHPVDPPDLGSNRPIAPTIPESPEECPGPGWEKHPEGNWIKEDWPDNQTIHPDFDHPPGKPPHSDWRDNWGNWWELYPGLAPGGGYFPKPGRVDRRKPQPIFPTPLPPIPFPIQSPPQPDPDCPCTPTYGVPWLDDLSWRKRWFGY